MANSREKRRLLLYKLCVSAVMLSLGLVLKLTTSVVIPIMGATGLKLDVSNIFTAFPAILFGPWFGGIVAAGADVLSAIIKPQGAFLPLLTVTQFLFGFLVGLLSKLILKDRIKKSGTRVIRVISLILIASLFILSLATHLSLINDGVMDSFFVQEENLKTMEENEELEKNILSSFVCKIASYSNNNITITSTYSSENIVIPSTITNDKVTWKVTALSKNAFANAHDSTAFYLPSTLKTIPDGIFDEMNGKFTIYTSSSIVEEYSKKNNIDCILLEEDDYNSKIESIEYNGLEYIVTASYKQSLFQYIVLFTIVMEIFSLITLAILIIGIFFGKKNELYLKILFVIFIPRMIITTINTEILRSTYTSWQTKSFLVLLIPRAVDAILTCLLLSYVIAILYDVYIKKIKTKITFVKEKE